MYSNVLKIFFEICNNRETFSRRPVLTTEGRYWYKTNIIKRDGSSHNAPLQQTIGLILWLTHEHGHHHSVDQAARRPHILCSICLHSLGGFGQSCTIVYCITSQPSNMFSNVPYLHFRRSPTGRLKSETGTFRPLGLERLGERGGQEWEYSIARPWVSISSRLPDWHICSISCRFPFLSYSAGSKSISVHPSVLDTMTNTALEATASSSGKNWSVDQKCCWRNYTARRVP